MRSSALRVVCSMLAVLANRSPASEVRIAITLSTSNPGSTRPSASDVRINSAAPTNRTTASATSTSTSTERVLFCLKPLPERLLESLMTVFKSVRALTMAGTRPNRIPVTSDNVSVNTTTRQSMPSSDPPSPKRGKPVVLTVRSARMPMKPSTRPRMPPVMESSTLSVSSCRRFASARRRAPYGSRSPGAVPSRARAADSRRLRMRPTARTRPHRRARAASCASRAPPFPAA